MTLDPAFSPRAMYATELRYKRERAKLSRQQLGDLLFVGYSMVAKWESGGRRVQPECAEVLDKVLDADGFFVRHLAAVLAPPGRAYPDVAELEALALAIREWEPLLIPDLLQTPAYAKAVIHGYDPVIADGAADERREGRLTRQQILADPGKLMYWAVVDESALLRPIGGPAVMAEQLRHVASLVRRKRILFQILPFSAGAHRGLQGALKLMTFDDDAPLAYVQAQETSLLIDDPATVKRCSLTYELVAAAARSPEESLSLIEAAAEDYE